MLTTEEKLLAEHLGLPITDTLTSSDIDKARRAAKRLSASKFETEKKKRYRLHKKVRQHVWLRPAARLMRVEDVTLAGIPDKVKKAIFELRDTYGYSLMAVIPGALELN